MDNRNGVSSAELAEAFGGKPKKKKAVGASAKGRKISIGVLVVGLVMLVVGVAFLVMNLISASKAADGEFLVEKGEWVLEDSESVIWKFTEVGKGSLTTNNHLNDYDFIWAIKDGKLLIETDWLYELEDEYEYELDQGAGVLVLKADDKTYKFMVK